MSRNSVRSDITERTSRLLSALFACAVLAVGLVAAPASGATGDVGFQAPSFSGATAPTGQKPESKLWYNDGRWWASMFHAPSRTWHIFYLNRSTSPKTWVDTGTVIDNRANTSSDTLWAGGKLYVASHVKAYSNTRVTTGQPARLYRYSYSTTTKKYTLDAGFPSNINNVSSETLVIDRDGAGRLWATWTQAQKVYLNATLSSGQWGTPYVPAVSNATGIRPDDISTLATLSGGIGLMWSNQSKSAVYFSKRSSSDPISRWQASTSITVPGSGQADDHLNIKEIQTTSTGRLFAVIKTNRESAGASAPQIVVLSRSSTGGWSRATFGRVGDCHSRPILMLDTTNNLVRVYASAPNSGCPYSGTAGSIFEKTSSMSSLSFPAGRGTPVMKDVASPNLNNVTGSKRSVNSTTGLVLLASNDVTKRYWSSDRSLG